MARKTAQKLILELKGVLAVEDVSTGDEEALEALMGLGYTRKDAAAALRNVQAETVEDRIKQALQRLSG